RAGCRLRRAARASVVVDPGGEALAGASVVQQLEHAAVRLQHLDLVYEAAALALELDFDDAAGKFRLHVRQNARERHELTLLDGSAGGGRGLGAKGGGGAQQPDGQRGETGNEEGRGAHGAEGKKRRLNDS